MCEQCGAITDKRFCNASCKGKFTSSKRIDARKSEATREKMRQRALASWASGARDKAVKAVEQSPRRQRKVDLLVAEAGDHQCKWEAILKAAGFAPGRGAPSWLKYGH